jgi:NTP pyrophosphatase (non-canonical NTP hydrolase)
MTRTKRKQATDTCALQRGRCKIVSQRLPHLLLHRVGQEVGELHQQVRVVSEQLRHLLQHLLDALLLLLVGVQDLQEGAVYTSR